ARREAGTPTDPGNHPAGGPMALVAGRAEDMPRTAVAPRREGRTVRRRGVGRAALRRRGSAGPGAVLGRPAAPREAVGAAPRAGGGAATAARHVRRRRAAGGAGSRLLLSGRTAR